MKEIFDKILEWQTGLTVDNTIEFKPTAFGTFLFEKGKDRVVIPKENAYEFIQKYT